jgi:hypothetical protein
VPQNAARRSGELKYSLIKSIRQKKQLIQVAVDRNGYKGSEQISMSRPPNGSGPVAGPMTSFAPRSGFSLDTLICSEPL